MPAAPDPALPRGAALLERRFAAVARTGPHCAWEERPGPLPVVVVAPHAIAPTDTRRRDAYTGPLAVAVGRETGASVLVAAKRAGVDPVRGDTPFAGRLAELAAAGKMVVELHGAPVDAIADVVVLVSGGASVAGREVLLEAFVEAIEDEELEVVVDAEGVGGHGEERLSALAAATGTAAFTVVVSAACRDPLVHPDRWEQIVDGLTAGVDALVHPVPADGM